MRLSDQNPMTRVLMVTLLFEVLVFGFAIPGMIQVSDRPLWIAFGGGGLAMAVALVAALTLRRGPGFIIGWATQIIGILLGFLTPFEFVMGTVFALLYAMIFVLGKRLDSRAPNPSGS